MALIVSRVVRPASKLATASWWDDTTLGADLGVAGASTDEVYAAMDWLLARQDGIEGALAAPAPRAGGEPGTDGVVRPVLLVGGRTPLPAGQARLLPRRQEEPPQIEYGLLTDPAGRPVAVRVFDGNTADPTAFVDAVAAMRDQVRAAPDGDGRGPRHDHHRPDRDRAGNASSARGLGWLTALRAPAIKPSPPTAGRCS